MMMMSLLTKMISITKMILITRMISITKMISMTKVALFYLLLVSASLMVLKYSALAGWGRSRSSLIKFDIGEIIRHLQHQSLKVIL